MPLPRYVVDVSLLRRNRDFRRVFLARTVSLFGLGFLAVALPVQVQDATGSSLAVGLVMALEGAGLAAGLLLGGVWADRTDHRRLILMARSLCGMGYVGLAINAFLPRPSLTVLFGFALWDGFFGAIGVSALLAAMPALVGRERLLQARALSMLSMRFVTILSPLLGGVIIGAGGLGWAYTGTAAATLLTVLMLLGLPALPPPAVPRQPALRMLGDGFRFLRNSRIVAGAVLVSAITTAMGAVRVLIPAMAQGHGSTDPLVAGLLFAAIPAGAVLGAVFCAWIGRLNRPVCVLALSALASCATVMLFGLSQDASQAALALIASGYAGSVAGLLQYTLVQGHTPDSHLGRVSALWTAQDALADGLGATLVGILAKAFGPGGAALGLGFGGVLLSLLAGYAFRAGRGAALHDPALAGPGEHKSIISGKDLADA